MRRVHGVHFHSSLTQRRRGRGNKCVQHVAKCVSLGHNPIYKRRKKVDPSKTQWTCWPLLTSKPPKAFLQRLLLLKGRQGTEKGQGNFGGTNTKATNFVPKTAYQITYRLLSLIEVEKFEKSLVKWPWQTGSGVFPSFFSPGSESVNELQQPGKKEKNISLSHLEHMLQRLEENWTWKICCCNVCYFFNVDKMQKNSNSVNKQYFDNFRAENDFLAVLKVHRR